MILPFDRSLVLYKKNTTHNITIVSVNTPKMGNIIFVVFVVSGGSNESVIEVFVVVFIDGEIEDLFVVDGIIMLFEDGDCVIIDDSGDLEGALLIRE